MLRDGVAAYADFLGSRGVARLVVAATFSRLTTSMLSLALLLAVQGGSGSYASSGAVMAAHAFALALAAPVSGRVADRFGARNVLISCIFLHCAAYLALVAAIGGGAPLQLTVAAAAMLGASTPPASAVLRSRWPALVEAKRLHVAYGFDAAHNSATFIAGPLLAAALALTFEPLAVVIGAGVFKITGDGLLATSLPGKERESASPGKPLNSLLGPLADGQLRLLLTVVALDTFTIGCLQVGAGVSGTGAGATGVLFAALAAGEVAGGLVYGGRRWRAGTRRQMVGLHLATAAILAVMARAPEALLLGLYLAAGLAGGARDALCQLTIGGSGQGQKAEAFAWLTTFMWGGYGLGTMAAGLFSEGGAGPIFMTGTAASLVAAALALGLRQGARTAGQSMPD